MTKEELREYRDLDGEIDVALSELERWQSRAEKMTPSYSNDGTSGGTINTESIIPIAVERIDEIRDKLQIDILTLAKKRIEIRDLISHIKKSKYRCILNLYYLQHKTFEETAEIMGIDVRWVHSLHSQVLTLIKDMN